MTTPETPLFAEQVTLSTRFPVRLRIEEDPMNEPLMERWRRSLAEAGIPFQESPSRGDGLHDRIFAFETTVGEALRLGIGWDFAEELAAALQNAFPWLDAEELTRRMEALQPEAPVRRAG